MTEGWILGGYSFRPTRRSDQGRRARRGRRPQRRRPAVRGDRRPSETAQTVASARNLVRDWVNNPPGDFTPATFADAVVATNKMRSRRPGHRQGLRRDGARRGRLRRHHRRRPRLGQPAAAGQADLQARGREGPPRAGRQGHHLRLGRPVDQAGGVDDDDEDGHGRRGRGRAPRRSRSPTSGCRCR